MGCRKERLETHPHQDLCAVALQATTQTSMSICLKLVQNTVHALRMRVLSLCIDMGEPSHNLV